MSLTLSQAAEVAGVSSTTVRAWIVSGYRGVMLKAQRRGLKWFVEQADLERFFKEAEATSDVKPKLPVIIQQHQPIDKRAEAALKRLRAEGVNV